MIPNIKKVFSAGSSFAILLTAIILISSATSKACNRSQVALYSIEYGAGYVDVTIKTTVGAGITGTQKGADAATRTFAFAVWGKGTVDFLDATPSATSKFTKANYPASVDFSGFLGTRFAVAYNYTGLDFTCVTSTATCGNVHTDTVTVTIRTDELPDSIRALGIEGAGSPVAGCYPDGDMLVNLSSLPVEWADFQAVPEANGVNLNWSTAVETNNDHFLVQRSTNGSDFETIDQVEAIGNSSDLSSYQYFDEHPVEGTSFYQIVQMDIDGKSSASEVVSVEFSVASGLFWTAIGPNPVHGALNLSFNSGEAQTLTLQVVDVQGRLVKQQQILAIQGVNTANLDLTGESSGFYYLRIAGTSEKIDKKILKI